MAHTSVPEYGQIWFVPNQQLDIRCHPIRLQIGYKLRQESIVFCPVVVVSRVHGARPLRSITTPQIAHFQNELGVIGTGGAKVGQNILKAALYGVGCMHECRGGAYSIPAKNPTWDRVLGTASAQVVKPHVCHDELRRSAGGCNFTRQYKMMLVFVPARGGHHKGLLAFEGTSSTTGD